MANEEQVERLNRSVQDWNAWRAEHLTEPIDLRCIDLKAANLSEADLFGANLSEANLMGANLSEANLMGANLRGTNLSYTTLMGADFRGAYLGETVYRPAKVIEPDLSRTYLKGTSQDGAPGRGTDLSHANLTSACFDFADLVQVNLSYANLFFTSLVGTDLSYANLTGAHLNYTMFASTNLSYAELTGADFDQARLGNTIFFSVDLRSVKGLDTIEHTSPSCVDINTVILPLGSTCIPFLRGVGFPDAFIDYLPSLLTMPIQYHSLFLSYSHHDQSFTRQLYNNLQNEGVRCWFAPHDLRPGIPIVRGIEEAIHLHDKLLLVLSKDAVMSNWVQQEVEAALYREATTGQEILFPVRLDNTILESDTLWARRLRQRHIGDFTGWQDDVAYQQAFTTLLRHLKVTQPPTNRSVSS